MRGLALSAAALVVPLLLAGCGADGGHGAASDPAPTRVETVGTYPEFAPTDYTFTLSVGCFCMGSDTPVAVSVSHGKVVGAVYTKDDTGRGGTAAGEAADQRFRMTIDDVIAKANDTTADHVIVRWPAGQSYPSRVTVDPDRDMADDEVSYTISNVHVKG